jgi:cellulose synthase/poly-beta-1,6-N-acetylglucosamine synthase-like glycosyltransferase
METLVSSLLAVCAGLLAIPIATFFLEVVSALALPPRDPTLSKSNAPRGRVAVLVPAHNEGNGLLPTIKDIQVQLLAGDRLLVVADNCNDNTATVASAAGAEVVERYDPTKRGKGYALDFGIRYLAAEPCNIVIVIDADCRLAEGAIERLARTCRMTRRPVQALYLMTAPAGSQINYRAAEFGWRLKNWVRPLGLSALQLPCQLVGTGMAFPWDVMRFVELANECLVEDLKLGVDLASAGYPPLFCPSALVTSQFASSAEGTAIQRERWDYGHIFLILTAVPRLLFNAIAQRNWGLLTLTLDLAIPPLSLLGLLVVATLVLASFAALAGISSLALVVSVLNALLILFAVFLAWLNYGRDILGRGALSSIALHVFKKLRLYRSFVSKRKERRWIRTDRTKL